MTLLQAPFHSRSDITGCILKVVQSQRLFLGDLPLVTIPAILNSLFMDIGCFIKHITSNTGMHDSSV